MLCSSGNSPCENGGTCTDGVGSYTCTCATGFCGPTCADPAQPNGQCPCADDPAWVTNDQFPHGDPCSFFDNPDNRPYCSQVVDAAGVTASEACPVSCQSPCTLTYDDCCELPAHLLSPCCLILYISLILLLVLSVLLRRVSKFSLISPSFSLTSLSFLSHVSPSIGTSHTSLVSLLHHSHFFHFSHNIV